MHYTLTLNVIYYWWDHVLFLIPQEKISEPTVYTNRNDLLFHENVAELHDVNLSSSSEQKQADSCPVYNYKDP